MSDDQSVQRDETTADFDATPPEGNVGIDRGKIMGDGVVVTSRWALRFIIIAIATAIVLWLMAQVWVGLLPVMLALIVATVLSGPVSWLRRRGWPDGLAAAVSLVGSLLILVGVLAAIAPSIIAQTGDVIDRAGEGITTVREWLAGPPINLDNEQFDGAISEAVGWLQDQASNIASGVFTGVSAVTSGLVTLGLTLVLTFFFIKDGHTFLPWVRRNAGRAAGQHLTELLSRAWQTLGGFIRTQAIVSAVDAIFIGIGLLVLGVPLAPALAILTFIGGFVPIVGAFVAGALAVLVALVSNGWVTAVWVLVIVLAVQQIEGNVLQPVLQSRTMKMHPGIILLAVAAGGTLFGIPGAFLAVPVAASVVVAIRYLSEQVDLRAGDLQPDELKFATPEGAITAREAQRAGQRLREQLEQQGVDDSVVGRDREASPATASAASASDAGTPRRHRLRRRKSRG